MSTKSKRRSRGALRTEERLHYKFITKYVEELHGDVFTQAQELFEDTKRKNPSVKDLTKTVEFITKVSPNKTVPRYYKNRQSRTMLDVSKPQMVLNIPLFTMPSQPLPPLPPVPPQSLPSPLTPTAPPLPPVPPQSLPSPLTPTPPVPPQSLPSPLTPTAPPLPLLPPDVYQNLLAELERDPELWKIMNDFPMSDEGMDDFPMSDEGMDEPVVNDIFLDDGVSPLEVEVEGY